MTPYESIYHLNGYVPVGLIAKLKTSRLNAFERKDEFTYRTLHQTNWAGVVDQMIRSNYRNWTTFLTEYEEDLLLFTSYQYVGTNREADDAAMAAHPTTQRWWKLAVPCLSPVEENAELWSAMKRLHSPG